MNKKGIAVGFAIVAALVIYFLPELSGVGTRSPSYSSNMVVTNTWTVTAEFPSSEIPLFNIRGYPLDLEPTVLSDEIPYVIHWEKTDGSGTIDEHIPARNQRPPGWTSGNPAKGKARAARFQVETGYPPVQIFYKLSPR